MLRIIRMSSRKHNGAPTSPLNVSRRIGLSRSLAALAIVAGLLLAPGCGRDKVTHVRIPKQAGATQQPAAHP